MIAHAVVAAAHGEGEGTDRAAAQWLTRSGFAPLPNVGITMLYFAARDPAVSEPAWWRCRTRDVPATGANVVDELRAHGTSIPKQIPPEFLARGRDLAADTVRGITCPPPRTRR